jgi:GntR family transcriptional repressor for pyruvate dehydrogenase complex
MSRTTRIDRRRLYQQIADDLEGQILSGNLAPGTRLPGEHELADQYEVSRNVIREALKRLKERGLVVILTGSGTYVSEPTTEPASNALHRLLQHSANGVTIDHFYEMRRMLEPASARLAAERGDEDDWQAIQSALEAMEKSRKDSEAWSHADLKFHLAVAAASHNPLLTTVLEPLTDPLRRVIAAGHTDPLGVQAGLDAHWRIFNALQKRNMDEAYQAMLDHLTDSEQRITKLGYNLTR